MILARFTWIMFDRKSTMASQSSKIWPSVVPRAVCLKDKIQQDTIQNRMLCNRFLIHGPSGGQHISYGTMVYRKG
jgi:hypothetical protein